MLRTFKYRLFPNNSQEKLLEQTLCVCCELYNTALEQRKMIYEVKKVSINYYYQANELSLLKKEISSYKKVHSQVLQDVLQRLNKAFEGFFRRVKSGSSKVGFPRFKSYQRYDSFTYPQSGYKIIGDKLELSKIGLLKIKLHRKLEGKIKTLTITKSKTGKWFVCFSCEVEKKILPVIDKKVGIDVGLSNFAVLNDNTIISPPKFFRKEEKELTKKQQKLSKSNKGTKEYLKFKKIIARIHERISNKRNNFCHQESRKIINDFQEIYLEDLNIKNMLKNHCFAKSISDASWGIFINFISYKAEDAGRKVGLVNARGTSQECSSCGTIVPKSLRERTHSCPSCRLVIDRDLNASLNILKRGLGLQTSECQTLQEATT